MNNLCAYQKVKGQVVCGECHVAVHASALKKHFVALHAGVKLHTAVGKPFRTFIQTIEHRCDAKHVIPVSCPAVEVEDDVQENKKEIQTDLACCEKDEKPDSIRDIEAAQGSDVLNDVEEQGGRLSGKDELVDLFEAVENVEESLQALNDVFHGREGPTGCTAEMDFLNEMKLVDATYKLGTSRLKDVFDPSFKYEAGMDSSAVETLVDDDGHLWDKVVGKTVEREEDGCIGLAEDGSNCVLQMTISKENFVKPDSGGTDCLIENLAKDAEQEIQNQDDVRPRSCRQNVADKVEFSKLELPPVGLLNKGSSCFMNSSIQALIRTPAVAGIIAEAEDCFHDCKSQECIICPLKGTVDEIRTGPGVVDPIRMWYLLDEFNWKFVRGRNQDAHEYMLAVLNEIVEPRSRSSNHLDTRRNLQMKFYGEMCQNITCTSCGMQSVKKLREPIVNLAVETEKIRSVQQGVNDYFGGSEQNELSSTCCTCSVTGRNKCVFTMLEPPDMLFVTLKRFKYDVAGNFGMKSEDVIHSNEILRIPRGVGRAFYGLSSIVRHHGSSLDNGHYTAVVKNKEHRYVQYNDEEVRAVEKVDCQEDYILIYELKPGGMFEDLHGVDSEAVDLDGVEIKGDITDLRYTKPEVKGSGTVEADQSDSETSSSSEDFLSVPEAMQGRLQHALNIRKRETLKNEEYSREINNSSESQTSSDADDQFSIDETDIEVFQRGINEKDKCSTPMEKNEDKNSESDDMPATEMQKTKSGKKLSRRKKSRHHEVSLEGEDNERNGMDDNELEKMEIPSKVFAKRERPFDSDEILQLLRAVQEGKITTPVLTNPPYDVCGSDVFVYKLQRPNDKDYLRDRINGFINVGTTRSKKPYKKVFYKMQDPRKPGSKEYVDFEKHCYWLVDHEGKPGSFVVIHYIGDEKLHVARPHGNDRKGKMFVKNTEKAKNDVREALLTDKRPKKVYNENVRLAEEQLGNEYQNSGDVMAARNTKQVHNIKYQEVRKGRLSQCEIFGIYLMALTDYGKMILDIRLMPIELYIVAEPSALQLARELLVESRKNPALEQLITYDTTFDMGDTYVSTLVMRNIYLKGAPIFPVAFNLHSRKHRKAHRAFWENMEEQLRLSNYAKFIPFTFDREAAFATELRRKVPDAQILFCRNHILTDVKVWLKKHGTNMDVAGYTKQLKVLMDSRSEEEFESKYENYRRMWSKPYVKYFEKYIKNDARSSSEFMSSKFTAFRDLIPTNNLSESLNAMLKQHCEYKVLPKDTLFLALHQLQLEILSNFKRSAGPSGDYTYKEEFANLCEKFDLPEYAHITQAKFVSVFRGVESDIKDMKLPEVLNTNRTLAEVCSEQKLVTYERKSKTFIVRSPSDTSKRNMLYFEPNTNKLHCSCICTTTLCYHKAAVLLDLGMDVPVKKRPEFNLTKLKTRKRTLEGRGRTGKKFKRRRVEEPIVNAAPDSAVRLGTGFRKPVMDMKGQTKKKNRKRVIGSAEVLEDNATWFHQDLLNEQEEQDRVQFGVAVQESNSEELRSSLKPKVTSESGFKNRVEEIVIDSDSDEVEETEYKDLKPETYINGSTISKVIAVIIDMAVMNEAIYAPDPYLEEIARRRDHHRLLDVALKYEMYTYDMLLQQMWVDNGTHYVLGGILFKQRVIFIMDSIKSSSKKRNPEFKILLQIASACLSTAGQLIHPSSWKYWYATDAPLQENGYDCGVYCARNVAAIVNRNKFNEVPYNTKKQDGRQWMVGLLKEKRVTRNERKNNNKLSTEEMSRATEHLVEIDNHVVEIGRKKINALLRKEVEALNKDWTRCGAELCVKDKQHERRQVRCIKCRKWFHENCESVQNVKKFNDFEFCRSCAP